MNLVRVGDKVINKDKIYRTVDRLLDMRSEGLSQAEAASLIGTDRSFVSRLEGLGEVRKGSRIALIGFPIQNKEALDDLCREYGLDKVTKVVVGGAERIHTVRAGLREVDPEAELIAIHDGARPLVPQQVLEQTVEKAAQTGAAAPAVPVTDTIKRGEKGLTVETVDRSSLWAVQTPQIFEAGLIRAAIEKAVEDQGELTDDCAAVERLGMKVSLTQGSRENIKITTPFDLLVGEAILDARGRGEL